VSLVAGGSAGDRVDAALEAINARGPDGRPPTLRTTDFEREPVVELLTDHGEVKVVPLPQGARGYEHLCRAANREPIGWGGRAPQSPLLPTSPAWFSASAANKTSPSSG
jgi:hypothetical protein